MLILGNYKYYFFDYYRFIEVFLFFLNMFFIGLENLDVRVEIKEDKFNFIVMVYSVKKLNVKVNFILQLILLKLI